LGEIGGDWGIGGLGDWGRGGDWGIGGLGERREQDAPTTN
jgi:hypothetical protein